MHTLQMKLSSGFKWFSLLHASSRWSRFLSAWFGNIWKPFQLTSMNIWFYIIYMWFLDFRYWCLPWAILGSTVLDLDNWNIKRYQLSHHHRLPGTKRPGQTIRGMSAQISEGAMASANRWTSKQLDWKNHLAPYLFVAHFPFKNLNSISKLYRW